MFIDESDFLSYRSFTKVVIPLLAVDDVALMMVTTLNTNPNVQYKRMFEQEVTSEGQHAFVQYTFKFQCDACRALNNDNCEHSEETRPDWNPEGNRRQIEWLLRHDMDTFDVEINAQGRTPSTQVFEQRYIERLFDEATHVCKNLDDMYTRPYHVFIAIDPNAGRIRDLPTPSVSNFAVVSFFRLPDGPFVLLGMEDMDLWNPREYTPFILKHIRRLVEHPKLINSKFVILTENRTGAESEHLKDAIRAEFNRPFYFMKFADNVKYGIMMSPDAKRQCVQNAINVFRDDRLFFDRSFFSEWVSQLKDARGLPKTIMHVKEEFKKQLENFSALRTITAKGKESETKYSGKLGLGMHDDIVMALIIGLKYALVYEHDPEFGSERA